MKLSNKINCLGYSVASGSYGKCAGQRGQGSETVSRDEYDCLGLKPKQKNSDLRSLFL
jgi:hypothetical protein